MNTVPEIIVDFSKKEITRISGMKFNGLIGKPQLECPKCNNSYFCKLINIVDIPDEIMDLLLYDRNPQIIFNLSFSRKKIKFINCVFLFNSKRQIFCEKFQSGCPYILFENDTINTSEVFLNMNVTIQQYINLISKAVHE